MKQNRIYYLYLSPFIANNMPQAPSRTECDNLSPAFLLFVEKFYKISVRVGCKYKAAFFSVRRPA